MLDFVPSLDAIRDYYQSNATRSYEFRKQQLEKFKLVIVKYEEDIYKALYSDLKKSREETWTTEIALLLSEIKLVLKYLHKWMRLQKVPAGLLTFPSSAKIYKDPLGVVLIISPWNYPLQLLLLPLAGAIAAGNCAVIKPSEMAPATEQVIKKMVEEAFDPRHVKVVTGDGSEVVPALMDRFKFDHIFYTGSTTVGREIYKRAANNLIPVTLELGGKSPCIVYEDADITVAAKRIVLGKFLNAGQTCIAPDYILVQENVKDKLLHELKDVIERFYTNDADKSADFGKIINDKRFKKIATYLNQQQIFYGGKYDEQALYIQPTLLTNVAMSDAVMHEEIFGPVLPVLPFTSTEEAMQIVNENKNPLALYLFTSDKKVEQEWMQKVPFGSGCVNNTVWQFANEHMPFGGIGNSGIGAYHGKSSFDIFSHAKPVLKTSTAIDPSLKYPPLKGKMKWFKKLMG